MRTISGLFLLLSLSSALPLGAAARAVFDNLDSISVANGPLLRLRVADFNNDTNPDVAALVDARLFLYLGKGDGSFAPPVITNAETPHLPDDIDFVLADVNADGLLDLGFAYSSSTSAIRVRIFHGVGDGSFVAGAQVDLGTLCRPATLALADVTNDGRPDILTCGLSVLPNLGDGTFGSAIVTEADPWLGRIEMADANGDGALDVFFGGSASSTLFISKGNGTFLEGVTIDSGEVSALGDLDANGRSDIVFLDEWKHDVAVRHGTLNGHYPSRVSAGFLTDTYEAFLTTADLNADGRDDILAGHDGTLSIWTTKEDGTPGPIRHYLVANSATHIASADFDKDGFVDVITGGSAQSWNSAVLSLVRGTAEGFMQAPVSHDFPRMLDDGTFLSEDLVGAGIFDATGDGILDAITFDGGRRIVVLTGLGNGDLGDPIHTIRSTSSYTSPTPSFADFNGDGDIDIVIADSSLAQIECWLGDGNGAFSKSDEHDAVTWSSSEIAPGDFNGDGNQDIVHGTYDAISLYPGRGDGTFGSPVSSPFRSMQILAGDINNDGFDDVITEMHTLLGSATGVFTAVEPNPVGEGQRVPFAIADFNGDGNLDIVQGGSILTVLLGNGAGAFQTTSTTEVRGYTSSPHPATPGDFNGDGHEDLTFGGLVLLGDGAGAFNGYARLGHVTALSAWAVGDLDGNGTSDLVLVGDDKVTAVPTWKVDSREAPLEIEVHPVPATFPLDGYLELDATVIDPGMLIPSGAVMFAIDGHVTGISPLVGGIARAAMRGRAVGSSTITMQFGGDDVYRSGTLLSFPVEITRARAEIQVDNSPQYPTSSDEVHVSGLVHSLAGGQTTGTITVLVDGVARGSASAPAFDINVGTLPLGPRAIKVQYSGDSTHLPGERTWSISISRPNPVLSFSITPPETSNAGQPVSLTVTFADPTITGTVTFYRGFGISNPLGTVAVDNAAASLITTNLPVGQVLLSGVFNGNAQYARYGLTYLHTVVDVPIATSASKFSVLTPCRVIDTRQPTGPFGGPAIAAVTTRGIQVTGRCGVPAGAKAIAVNLTVVAPTQVGFLTLFPGASPRSGTSTINYRTAKTRANNAIVPLSAGGILNIYNSGPNEEHFLIDVTGYFH